jgi:hypothetical protein
MQCIMHQHQSEGGGLRQGMLGPIIWVVEADVGQPGRSNTLKGNAVIQEQKAGNHCEAISHAVQ